MSGILPSTAKTPLPQSSHARPKSSAKKETRRCALTSPAAETKIERAQTQECEQAENNDIYQRLCDYLHSLHRENPSIHFKIVSLSDDEAIRNFATSASSGAHMSISAEFLNRMLANEEAFLSGQKRIDAVIGALLNAAAQQEPGNAPFVGAVIKDDGQASLWSFSPTAPPEDAAVKKFFAVMKTDGIIRNYKENGGRNITEIRTSAGIFKFVFIKRLNYSSTKDLKRLAQITTPGNVRAFISGLNAYANQIRSDKALDEKEAAAAIAKIRGVIRRAGVKISSLHDEDLLKQQSLRQLKRQEIKKALETKRQLQKKRTARHCREYGAMDKTPLPKYIYDKKHAENAFSANDSVFNPAAAIDITSAAAPCAPSSDAGSLSIEAVNVEI